MTRLQILDAIKGGIYVIERKIYIIILWIDRLCKYFQLTFIQNLIYIEITTTICNKHVQIEEEEDSISIQKKIFFFILNK